MNEILERLEEVHKSWKQGQDEVEASVKAIKARTDEMEQRLNTPTSTGGGGGWSGEKAEVWEDSEGRECKMLRGKARMQQGGEPFLVGKIVQSMLDGKQTALTKTQEVVNDSRGGFNSPPAMSGSVIDLARARSVLASAGVGTLTLEGGSLAGRMLRRTGTDPLVSWTAERQEIPEGEVTFGILNYRLRKCAALIELTHEFTTTPNGPQMIEDAIGKALAAEMDRIALLGSGAGEEPIGISNWPGIGGITSVGDVNYDDFLNAVKTVRNANHEPGAAVFSPGTEYELSILKAVADGQYLNPPAAYTNLPKHVTTKCTDALAFVGDFTQSAWVVGAGGIRFEMGHDGNFKKDCIFLRVIMPLDFVVFNPAAFCKLSGLS